MHHILLLLLVLGCSKPGPEDSGTGTSVENITYQNVVTRLNSQFVDQGFVVSRGTANADENIGDSLFFTGLAVYGMKCADGANLATSIEQMLLSGKVSRFPGDNDSVSMDAYLGLYRGIAARVIRCGEAARWAKALKAVPVVELPAGFDYVRLKTLSAVGSAGDPTHSELITMETSATAWAWADLTAKSACYRVNLALIALQTAQMLGDNIDRSGFCAATSGAKIATVDAFCGRSPLDGALNAFQENVWDYHWERCDAWESPDANGFKTPAVDYLVAFADETGLQ